MKKSLALLLTLLMVFSMAACTDTVSSPDGPTPGTPTAPTYDVSGFEETILIDNEYCTIKATSIDPDNIWGYTLNMYLENKSQDTTMTFSIYDATLNGVTCDPFFATDITPGAKSNSEINFSTDALPEEVASCITDICMIFRVSDSSDWTAEDLVNETVHVYPLGEEAAQTYVYEMQPTDKVLVDNEYATVICTGFEDDEIWGYTMNLYIENKTDTNMMLSLDDVTVNGFMADPFYATDVMPGSSAFSGVSWSDEIFEENGITDVEEITFTMRSYDNNDWSADDFFNEAAVVNP